MVAFVALAVKRAVHYPPIPPAFLFCQNTFPTLPRQQCEDVIKREWKNRERETTNTRYLKDRGEARREEEERETRQK